jgi:ribose 1,5-bisphosphokinase
MNHHLIYVVGPSGVGKDTLLDWLRSNLPKHLPAHWAQRTIDRPSVPDGEAHESVTPDAFKSLLAAQSFALHWQANGHQYGIRHAQLAPMPHQLVFVNGSREHLPLAAQSYAGMTVLHITADKEVLRQRLLLRNRESHAEIELRLNRLITLVPPADCAFFEIQNNDSLQASGQQLLLAVSSINSGVSSVSGDSNLTLVGGNTNEKQEPTPTSL